MPVDLLNPPPRAALAAARTLPELVRPAVTGAYRDLRSSRSGAPSSVARTAFDPTDSETIPNPYPDYERIRRHPVVFNDRLGVWILGRHANVHAAARDNVTFSSADGIFMRSVVLPTVVSSDQPDHTRLRRIATPVFSRKSVSVLEADIRTIAEDAVSSLQSGDVVDLVPALTIPMPVDVIARILGVPRADWTAFRAIAEHFATAFAPQTSLEMMRFFGSSAKAYVQLRAFFDAEFKRRAVEPADDFLGRLQEGLTDGQLSKDEAFWFALLALGAGSETTTNLLGMLLFQIAEDPDLFAALKADRSLLPAAVEEAARWASPAQWVTRRTTVDYDLDGTVIPRGARVVLLYGSANRDPDKFPDPDRFDIHRKPTGHLAFGNGIHFCLGAHLSRLEVVTAIDHLLDEIDGLEMAGPVTWTKTPSLRGPTSVPVRIRQRPA